MQIIKDAAEYDAVLKENTSVFVDFYADWCGPCKMAAPIVEALAEIHTGVKFVKVNVDDNHDIAQRYGIMSIPTMIAIKNGEIASQNVGFAPQNIMEEIVKACE